MFDAAVVGTFFLNLFNVPKGCNIGDWEGRCEMARERQAEGRINRNE